MKYVYVVTSCSLSNYTVYNEVHSVHTKLKDAKAQIIKLSNRLCRHGAPSYYIDKRKVR